MTTLSLADYFDLATACRRFERSPFETAILGFLTVALVTSHLPLCAQVRRLGSCHGISAQSSWILALISTEHLASTVFETSYPVFAPHCVHMRLLHFQSVLGVYVDIAQPLFHWLTCILLFAINIRETPKAGRLTGLLALYILLFLVPVVWWPATGLSEAQGASVIFQCIRRGLRLMSTILCLLQPLPQILMGTNLRRGDPRKLTISPWTMAMQSIIFACLSAHWFWRLHDILPDNRESIVAWGVEWYERGGWRVVNFGLLSAALSFSLRDAIEPNLVGVSNEAMEPWAQYADDAKLIDA